MELRTSCVAFLVVALTAGACARAGSTESADTTTSSTGASGFEPTGSTGSGDDGSRVPPASWSEGPLPAPLPSFAGLRALPGSASGNPLLMSHNPESFSGPGLLYGTGGTSPSRGSGALPLVGDVGVWFHHVNASGGARWFSLLVRNVDADGITVGAEGSGFTASEVGGQGLQASPDFFVTRRWITGAHAFVQEPTALAPGQSSIVWQRSVKAGEPIDGRFVLHVSGKATAFLVASDASGLNDVVAASAVDAPGALDSPSKDPLSFGRTAGVYAGDLWQGAILAKVPKGERHVGFPLLSANGLGHPEVQAVAALTHAEDSAAESVGMHGMVYDLGVRLDHDGDGDATRHVTLVLASYADDGASRDWDGIFLLDGKPLPVSLTSLHPRAPLVALSLVRGESRILHLQAMVPGMATMPFGLFFVTE